MLRRLCLALGILTIAGCNCGTETPPGTVGEPCESIEDCGAGLECAQEVCGCPNATAACGEICCASGQICGADGVCATSCPGELPACGAVCCAVGESCQAGACTATCDTVNCNGTCCASGEQCLDSTTCCAPENQCNGACCGAGQLCEAGQCRMDCGNGNPGCGAQDVCCGAAEICYLGQCLVPGDACTPGMACATQPEMRPCPDGQICEPSLMLCVPQDVNEACVYMPPAGVFEPVPLFTWGQRRARMCMNDDECQTAEVCQAGLCEVTWPHVTPASDDMPQHYQSSSIPMVTDLDGDCVPEIIFNTYADSAYTRDGVLRAIRGDTGAKLWTVSDPAYRTDASANPAIGDVDGDGQPEVFVTGPGKNVLRFASDGTPVWISDAFTGPEGSASVALANLDAEGDAEIILGAAVFDSAGQLLFEGTAGRGHAGQGPISCIADLNDDGRPELVAGNTVYGFTGAVSNGDFAGAELARAGVPDGYCGIADMDTDGSPEVVLVTGGQVYVLNGQTMTQLAAFTIPGGGNGGAPNIADFDGDGRPDIGTAGATNYVVLAYRGPDQLELLWRAPTEDDSSSRTGSSVFDFDGDGRAEVIYNDEEFVRIYPGVEPACLQMPVGAACDGVMNDDEILFRDLNSSRTRTEYPVIADVDGDFKAEIVFATSNEANFLDPQFVGDAGIEVWADRLDNWVSTRPVWNQHSYHITNSGPRAQVPQSEAPSWSTPTGAPYNSYRRNAQGDRATFCAPDLVVREVSQDSAGCPAMVLRVTLVNQGCLGVGAGLQVAVYSAAGDLLATSQTTAALGPGSAQVIEISVPRTGTWMQQVRVTVDDDGMGQGALNECEERNNASDLLDVGCRFDF